MAEQDERLSVPVKAVALAASLDISLNKAVGWEENAMARNLEALFRFGRLEVGWRQSCGSTDPTQKQYRAWLRLLKAVEKEGVSIKATPVKHGNSYATKKGGFWSSVIYELQTKGATK